MGDSAKKRAEADEAADIVASIRNVFENYFNTFDTEGDPLQNEFTKTYFGVYDAYEVKHRFPVAKPVDYSDPNSPKKPFRYRLKYDPVPVAWIADENGDAIVDPKWKPSSKRRVMHLWNSRPLIDPVHDDLLEMRAAGFPYANEIASQSSDAREVYYRNLSEIIDRPASLASDEDGRKFIKALAMYGTYDANGDYYPKWKPDKKGMAPLPSALTDEYFKASFREVTLYEDCFYVLRQNELFSEITLLWVDEKAHGLHRVQYYGQKNKRYELTTYKKKKALHDNFIFLYSVHGKPKSWMGNVPRPTQWAGKYEVNNPKGHSAYRRRIDVRAVVESAIADDASANELELRDEFEWLVEYVKAVFPLRLAVFRISEYERGGIWKAPRDEIASIRKHVYTKLLHSKAPDKDFGGPISKLVLKQLEELMKDEDVLVLPQGLKTGEHTHLIGGDSEFMYEHDRRTGAVYMINAGKYLHELYLGQLSGEVYESTRGMQPFIHVVVWGGLIMMGVGILEISPVAIRTWLVHQIEERITSEVIRQMVWKFFRPAIIALIIELILYMFELAAQTLPPAHMTDFEGRKLEPDKVVVVARRMRLVAKGFFTGYLVNTMVDHFYKHLIVDSLEKGVMNIREVKAYMLVKQAYAAIDKVRETIHTIEKELDAPAMHKGTLLLQETTARIARASAGIFAALYHLPYSEAKDVLKALGMDPKGKPPSPEQWEVEAQVQLKKIIGTFQKLTSLKSIDEALEDLQTGRLLPVAGTILVLEAEIIWVAEHTALEVYKTLPKKWKPFVLVALGVIAAAGVVAADIYSDGAVHRVGWNLIKDMAHLPSSDEEAVRLGELVGNLFGAQFFNSAMFDKGGLFHDFREKHPLAGGALWGNVKASPIQAVVTLLLKRYIFLYDRVKKDLKGLTRVAGERAFVDAMHSMEDQALEDDGFGHLKAFRTQDEDQVSLQNIALTLFRIRHVVKSDLKDWIKTRYGDDIAAYKADLLKLNELGEAATKINVVNVAQQDLPHIYHLMAQHLNQVLDEIVLMFQKLFEPFTKGQLSWATFMKALGVAIGDVKKIQKHIMDDAKQELEALKQIGGS